MNPDTKQFEQLFEEISDDKALAPLVDELAQLSNLVFADGSPVPDTWSIFTEGEQVVIKDCTFEVVRIGKSYLVLEPAKLALVGK